MHTVPELFRRHSRNPILHQGNWPYQVNSVFNPAAALVDGEVVLLARAEDRRGLSHLTVARSANGTSGWRVEPEPAILPETHKGDEWGVEDPRLTYLAERGEWAVVFTEYSVAGPQLGIALTQDFRAFDRIVPSIGPVEKAGDKDAAILPRRIDGRWAMIHRPAVKDTADMWMSFSDDLAEWRDSEPFMLARRGVWWDANKIGLSSPPLETPDGWLMMYHGAKSTPGGCLYRAGLALLDLEDPRKVLHRADEWVFGPHAQYEMSGDVGNVVFPCGWVADKGMVFMYYGAADTCVAVASASLDELLKFVKGMKC